ncbi:MAG TPA: hypothetical protein PKV27_11810, partial [Ilumatobacteraceae bacterium]|nr:hypothetical protein [Ilumatobacteraceae bacterium]
NAVADPTAVVSLPVQSAQTSEQPTSVPSEVQGGDSNAQTSDTAPDGPVDVDVLIGVDDSPTRVATVRAGNTVQLNLTNPDAADTFRVTGLDVNRSVDAGVTATINIDVTKVGSFPVTSAVIGGVVLVLEVV